MRGWLITAVGLALVGAVALAWWLWPAPASDDVPRVEAPPSLIRGKPVNQQPQLALEALEEPRATDAGVATLIVTVRDEADRPVGGATVEVFAQAHAPYEALRCDICAESAFDCHHADTTRLLLEAMRAGRLRSRPVASGQTDRSGQVALTDVPAVPLLVVGRSARGARGSASVEPDQEEATLTVAPTQEQVQLVLDLEANPLAGARITTFDLESFEVREQVTGEDGTVTIPVGGGAVWVAGEKAGFVPTSQLYGEDLPLTLMEKRALLVHTRIAGKPVDAEVSVEGLHPRVLPAPGGELLIEELNDAYSVQARAQGLASSQHMLAPGMKEVTIELLAAARLMLTLVDEAGEPVPEAQIDLSSENASASASISRGELAVLGPVPEGAYRLTVYADGFRDVGQQVDLAAGDQALELALKGSVHVEGTVVDQRGAPVPGATVSVVLALGTVSEASATTADGEGRFTLTVSEPGDWTLEAEERTQGVGTAHVRVPTAAPVVITLDPRAELVVRLSGERGQPVKGLVAVGDSRSPPFSDETDEQGVVRFSGLEPGSHQVVANVDGLLPAEQAVVLEDHRVKELVLTLVKGVAITGRVVDERGRPLPASTVFSRIPQGSGGVTASATTGDDGAFVLEPLVAGTVYEVSMLSADGASLGGDGKRVPAPATDVVLVGASPRSVRGRVVDESGRPVVAFQVNDTAVNAADGRFVVEVFGTSLSFWAEGYMGDVVEVSGPEAGDVVLKRFRRFEGAVVDAEGRPVPGASVSSAVFWSDTSTAADGRFGAQLAVDDGAFEVTARRGLLKGTATAHPDTSVVIALNRPVQVRGLVLGPDGRPQSTTVFVTGVDSVETLKVDARADGRFEVQLAEGRWSFATRAAGAEQVFEVRGPVQEVVLGGAGASCALTITPTAPLGEAWLVPPSAAGTVTGPDGAGEPPPGTVRIAASQSRQPMRAAGVPCTDYVLVAYFNEGVTALPVSLHGEQAVQVSPPPVQPEPAP